MKSKIENKESKKGFLPKKKDLPEAKLPLPYEKGIGPWKMIWLRFKNNKIAIFGLVMIGIIALFAIAGPMLSPYGRDEINLAAVHQAPNAEHIFGTDNLGRDMFTRIAYGARLSLTVGIMSTAITIVLAVIMGGLSGFFGGVVDMVIQRFGEILSSIPFMPLMITLSAIMGGKVQEEFKMYIIMALIGILGWPGLCRVIRAEIFTLKEREFVVAAKAMGYSVPRQIFIHLIPNTIAYLVLNVCSGMAGAIMTEAGLSFLGLGVAPPVPTWGNMLTDATNPYNMQFRLWLWVIPGIFLFMTVLSINFVGEGLRDAFDPKEQR